jgi:alanine adding enzyme
MFFTRLTKKEYGDFISDHPVHFTQSVDQYNYREQNKGDVHLVGVKNNNNICRSLFIIRSKSNENFQILLFT